MAKMHATYEKYSFAFDDIRDEIIKMLEKYEKENYEDTEYYFGYVDGVWGVVKMMDDLLDKRTMEYQAEEPGSFFGPSIDW